jgi:hypothetical protein
VKCITLNVDWKVKRTKKLQSLDKLNLLYWDHKQDLSSNPKKYPSPPYSLERFGKLDFESLSLNLEEIQRSKGQLNVTRFKEGRLLSWKSLGYDVLQELDMCRGDNNNLVYFLYLVEPNAKRKKDFLSISSFFG